MRTADRVQHALADFPEPVNLQIGDRVIDRHGTPAIVLGVGIVDYQPDGPAYEVAEIEDREDGRKRLVWALDLEFDADEGKDQ